MEHSAHPTPDVTARRSRVLAPEEPSRILVEPGTGMMTVSPIEILSGSLIVSLLAAIRSSIVTSKRFAIFDIVSPDLTM